MENRSFIDTLFKQEKALFEIVINSKEYRELCLIQGLLVVRGKSPNFSLLEETKKIIYNTSVINGKAYIAEPKTYSYPGEYDKKTDWTTKTRYALDILKKASPREIIDFLAKKEKDETPEFKAKISANIYNVLSKLYKNKLAIKDGSNPDKPMYELKP